MDKVKINVEGLTPEIVEVTCKNGDKIHVKTYIPFSEKEEVAIDMANRLLIEEENGEYLGRSYLHELVRTFEIVKHYTDIDVTDFNSDDGVRQLCDYLQMNGLLLQIKNIVDNDVFEIDDMFYRLSQHIIDLNTYRNSLSTKIKKSFSSILTDEDFIETMAKSKEVNEKMIDWLGAFKREEAAQSQLGPVRLPNNVVKFGKRK